MASSSLVALSLSVALQLVWDDGDSGKRATGSKFRLHDFDAAETWRAECPEERAEGYRAKAIAEALTEGRKVRERKFWYRDRFGRRVVDLDVDGKDLATALAEAGAGVQYDHDGGEAPPDWCKSASGDR